MKLEVELWEMKEGKPTALKLDNQVFIIDGTKQRGIKVPYLKKWIQQNHIKTFQLDDFFKVYPKQKERKHNLELVISDMIQNRELEQLANDKFRVL